jgi:hypothetical protein
MVEATKTPATPQTPETRSILPRLTAKTPNYISQDEDDVPPITRRTTRSTSNGTTQEAMLSCVDADPEHSAALPIPMTDFREMANTVIGDNGELLEYRHLIANQKTRAIWHHSYGNKLGRLIQGMPGQNEGTNTMFFIRRDQVPWDRVKDVTYGLITTLIQLEKEEI